MNLHTTLLMTHICGAVLGLISGYLAMLLRKGGGLHNAAGTVFFASMMGMNISAAFIATYFRPNSINSIASLLTFYLVLTAWWTARHREARTTLFDYAASFFVVVVAIGAFSFGFEAAASKTRSLDRMPAPAYFVFATIALLHVIGDVRMLARGGVAGTRRIARHLSRMCTALLITTLSLYPGQAKIFSPAWKRSPFIFAPHLFLIGAMIYWRIRMRNRKRQASEPTVAAAHERALAA
jgi:uncharacterized membrane protein